jgi:CRP/FNR family transcriptional regulator, dissimilatory nitrate respiration regulator
MDKLNIEKFLSKVFLFSELNPAELKLVSSVAYSKKLKKNEILFHEGDDASYFFVVAYGKFKVFINDSNGSDITIHIHGERELLAEAAIFSEKDYPASCVALEDSLLVFIPRAEFVSLIGQKPKLALKFMSAYSKRMRSFVRQIEDISSMEVKQRVVSYIIDNLNSTKQKNIVELAFSKKELASFLGTSPENLSRIFAFLQKKELIKVNGRTILVKDINKLRTIKNKEA